jgi:hypothetical protein
MKIEDLQFMTLRMCLESEPAKTSEGKLPMGLRKRHITETSGPYGEFCEASDLFRSIIVEFALGLNWKGNI